MKKKKMNRGYLLLEAVYGFTILLTAIAIYLPLLMNMLEKVEMSRHHTQISREIYEQVQHVTSSSAAALKGHFTINQKEYKWQFMEVGGLTGVQIKDEKMFHYVPSQFEQQE